MCQTTDNPKATRLKHKLSQTKFWGRIGVTQSAGSRFENGRKLPKPVKTLMRLAYAPSSEATKTFAGLRES